LLLGVEQPHQAWAVRHRPQRWEALENIAGVVDGDIAVAAGLGEVVVDTWAVEWMREGVVVAAAVELLGLEQQPLVAAVDGRAAAEDKLGTAVVGRLLPSRQAVWSDHAMRCYC